MTSGERGESVTSVEKSQPEVGRKLTPYEKVTKDLSNDPNAMKEITLGKRIGFYKIRSELGSGNFSQVKMGVHTLTKGKLLYFLFVRR